MLPVFADGQTLYPGVRGHRCYNSGSLRKYGTRIVNKLASHYSVHPAVIGRQTDNEFGMIDCHSDRCNEAFRDWVQDKYKTLEHVNAEWGTVVWSGEYSDWQELTVPYGGSPFQNPSLLLDIQPQAEGMDYYENIKLYHRVLTKLGIGCDVIQAGEPLERYKLIIAPSLYLLSEELAAQLEAFAIKGGTLILTNRSGVKDTNNICVMQPLPGMLSRAAGVWVKEYDPVGGDVHTIKDQEGHSFECSQWCDLLAPVTAEPIAWYNDDFYAGTPGCYCQQLRQRPGLLLWDPCRRRLLVHTADGARRQA
ncbi:Beta-galactosidase BgaA [compost metagenome]